MDLLSVLIDSEVRRRRPRAVANFGIGTLAFYPSGTGVLLMPQRLALSLAALLVGAGVIAAASASAQPAPSDAVVTFGDWKKDAPGVRHHITLADLPPPSQGT